MKLILSMNKDGLLSLWDTRETRDNGARTEIHIDLELTGSQKNAIGRAWIEAKDADDQPRTRQTVPPTRQTVPPTRQTTPEPSVDFQE